MGSAVTETVGKKSGVLALFCPAGEPQPIVAGQCRTTPYAATGTKSRKSALPSSKNYPTVSQISSI
jgi:hypothetical protein